MFGSLLLNTPSSSTTPHVLPNKKQDDTDKSPSQQQIVSDHELEEDDFGCGMGIVHMGNDDIAPQAIHEATAINGGDSNGTVRKGPQRKPSPDALAMLTFDSADAVVEHEAAENQSSRAKRRHRRASLSIVVPHATEETGRVSGGKKKRMDNSSDVSDGVNNSADALNVQPDHQCLVSRGSSSSLISLNSVTSSSTIISDNFDVYRNEKVPMRDECVDNKIVSLVMDPSCIDIGQITQEHSLNIKQAMKQSFDSFAIAEGKDCNPRRSKMLASAVAAIGRVHLPASYLTLLLALAHVNLPKVLDPDCMVYFDKLQLSLLSLSCQSPISAANSNPFASLVASSSSQPSTPKKSGVKRLRFHDAGLPASTCVSPPNDREPGSAEKFESYASMLDELLTSCDELVCATSNNTNLHDIISVLVQSFAELSNNNELINSLLQFLLLPGQEPSDVSAVEISHMAKILCTELSVRRYIATCRGSLTNCSPSLDHLSIPYHAHAGYKPMELSCTFRSVLRHRASWVLTSVLR
jgi:hypothetical protein